MHSAGMPFNGDTVKTKSLGGSESAAYYMARELAARGHDVVIFTSDPSVGAGKKFEGVTYACHGQPTEASKLGETFDHYATNTPHDLLIIQRAPFAFNKQYAAKVCFWQLHDLALYRLGQQILGGTWQIDYTTVVSEFHKEQVHKVWNIPKDYIRVVPNGVDSTLYKSPCGTVVVRNQETFGVARADNATQISVPGGKFLLLYQSRPERGLQNALEVMEKCASAGLPVHLLVCGYDNTTDQMRDFYASLYARANALPNVTLLGALTKPELAVLQQNCDVLFYPTRFEEVSCITAMEAMHAGLPLLSSAHAALPETCKGSGSVLLPLKDDQVDEEGFFKKLTEWFGMVVHGTGYPQELNDLRVQQIDAAGSRTWQVAVDEVERAYSDALSRRFNYDSALRNAIEHSDIGFAKHLISDATVNDRPRSAIFEGAVSEINRLYEFAESQEKYEAHYAKHQGIYYDGHEDKVIGEDVTGTMRFRGVGGMFYEHLDKVKKPCRVLDYGCAHGHYTMPLARDFPSCDFVGMDISQRAVNAAKKWQTKAAVKNAEFIVGSQADLTESLGKFDVIIAGEVLEHVMDYHALVEKLRALLTPDGCIIFTTPLGRWENSGTEAFRTGREHLHHFDYGDIKDICAGHEHYIVHAPAGHDRSGFHLSSWVWRIYPKDGLPTWKVDYNRKLLNYAPRETISACIIVKNGEKTLRRCVESIIDWVDEVVIAVDPTTEDRTKEVIYNLTVDFPNRPFKVLEGKEALKDGFAAARNVTVEAASGQWIVWIDADEELRNPWFMHKMARPSMHNGYGWAQIHYSVDPDQVLTVDFPCRMFRNNGAKFYGFVHEHPETSLGKGIECSLVRPEMKFLHHGYFDEEVRRKRFERNLPLLMRDVAEYPTERPLNQFLHLRDVAQGIQFDAQRMGGFNPALMDRARLGIQLMEGIIKLPQVKMIADSMQYYSLCVAALGMGFDASVSVHTQNPLAPDLAVKLNFQGRFHSRKFYEELVSKVNQECTKTYEERYF
jgi:2-polyprenyl-3-methyl-5-hydroxy-6-metoxy-1,4-benzoquinol methylase/glycosyltransferase involved in cell wall biosynthesis